MFCDWTAAHVTEIIIYMTMTEEEEKEKNPSYKLLMFNV